LKRALDCLDILHYYIDGCGGDEQEEIESTMKKNKIIILIAVLFVLSCKNNQKEGNQLINEKADLFKKLEVFENEKTIAIKTNIKSEIRNSNGVNVLVQFINISNAEQLKNLSFQLKTEVDNLFCVLGCVLNEKPMLSVIISDNLVKEKGLHAGNIIKELAKEIKGGGGGRPFYATAGGIDENGLQTALEKANNLI
jgi:alanyl-tRNA synthetase